MTPTECLTLPQVILISFLPFSWNVEYVTFLLAGP